MRAAIVLGGGASTRFGRADKLLAPLKGKPLLAYALDCALASDAKRVILVVRRNGARIARLVRKRPVSLVVADRGMEGVSASLRAAFRALRPIEREAWIFLADMPDAAARRGVRLGERDAARPCLGDVPGHPMLVRVTTARRLALAGDHGLGRMPARRWRGRPGNILDVDDRATLRRLHYRRR